MTPRTFKYIGDLRAIRIWGNELVKGEPFTTDNHLLAKALKERKDVEEVTIESKRSSRKDADRS